MRVSGIFIQENPAEKVKNDDLLGQKPLKLVWKQSIFLDLSGLSNYNRTLPSQYFSDISAWKLRRFAPLNFDAARRRSSIWLRLNCLLSALDSNTAFAPA